jgi:uncharacterized membrane protein (DUF441 family)
VSSGFFCWEYGKLSKLNKRTEVFILESWLFLLIILAVSYFGKNQSLLIATGVVLALKLIPNTAKLLNTIQAKGINWGVTVISVAILVPIATGQIGFRDLLNAFKSPVGYVAVTCGVLVAVLSAKGVGLLSQSPEITVALVFGTIMGVVLLRGIAAGPVIASGMTYVILQLLQPILK